MNERPFDREDFVSPDDAFAPRSDPTVRRPTSTRLTRQRRRRSTALIAVITLVVIWSAFAFARPTPTPHLVTVLGPNEVLSGSPFSVSPPYGVEEAVTVGGLGSFATANAETQSPIASLTKMMSALVILHDHPLAIGQSGPNLVITPSDVAQYHLEKSKGDSVVAVYAGESISELQALEAVLIPSADNVTQLLAQWDAGSQSAFVAKMNALAQSIGARHTRYAGPSGVNPQSVSTASDQLLVAKYAMKNPVFAGIVSMAQVTLPVAGIVYNVNGDLGTKGIDGVKTGWLPQSGGCVVIAAHDRVGTKNVSMLGVILGEQGLTPIPSVLRAARHLVTNVDANLRIFKLKAAKKIANYDAANGQVIPLVTSSKMSLPAMGGESLRVYARLSSTVPASLAAGTVVGTVTITVGNQHASSYLKTASALTGSSLWWRFTHL
ncbi:MAG: D-alanyl-D-alanine carboxypeptidase family protein [Acidimicrobiales bacterium]